MIRTDQPATTATGCSVKILDWLNGLMDRYARTYATKTYKEKQSCFRRFVAAVGPEVPVLELITPDPLGLPLPSRILLDYFDGREDAGSGYATNKDRKNLRKAWEDGPRLVPRFPRMAFNPFDGIERRRETRHRRYVPAAKDFWKAFDAADGQDRVLLLTFLHLAARRGEVFSNGEDKPGLTWDDVDFANREITLWTRKRVGGDLEADTLPMTDELRRTLLWWWENRPARRETVFFCVTMRDDGQKHERWGLPFRSRQRFLGKLCERVGVKPFSYHAIRHFTARHLHEQGYPIGFVQRILRHQNEKTTRDYLEKLGVTTIRETVEAGMPRVKAGELLKFPEMTATKKASGSDNS
ncbi:MAG: site-specific integrase [Proteobacteria bacterium]|nr:site-specific integrase [Pseudomonadota bacterium]